jgi:PAS domain S-box-containing protein
MSPDMSELRELSGGDFIADTRNPSRAWLRDYIPPEDQAHVIAATEDAIRTKSVFELEHQVRQLDGGIGWALSRAVPILGRDGEIVEWFGAASDITPRKLAEKTQRQGQERQTFLLKLSDTLRAEPSGEAIATRALQMLLEEMGLDRCYVGIYRLAEDIAEFPQQVHDTRLPPMPARVRLSDFPEALRISFDRTLVVDDAMEMECFSDSDRASFSSLSLRAVIAATLRKGSNNPLWAIVAGSANARVWTQSEVALVEEVAERTWAAVERARAETALSNSEERFRQFSDASVNVLWIRNAATLKMEYASRAFDAIYGVPAPARGGEASLRPWLRLIEAESRNAVLDNFRRVRAGEQAETEFRIRRASDGALRWVHCTDFPLRDAAGKVAWLAGVGADITDTKEAADRQGILVAELQHRTRNLIAVVRSLADRTLGNAASLKDFGERFGLRLSALARVQGLLSNLAAGQKVTFGDLLIAELSAHGAVDDAANKITLDGPSDVPLRSGTVQTLALGLHELATNAVKYGALSGPDGQLTVRWHVEPMSGREPARLHVDWRENGVVMSDIDAPASGRGYGRELIERALSYQLKAKTSFVLGADGVRCTIAVPIASSCCGKINAPFTLPLSGRAS